MAENSCLCGLKVLKGHSNLMLSGFGVFVFETVLNSAGAVSWEFHMGVVLFWSNVTHCP